MKNAKKLSKGLHIVVMATTVFYLSAIGLLIIPNTATAGQIPEFTLSKTDNQETASPGDTLTYEISAGFTLVDSASINARLVDTLPDNFTVDEASISDSGSYDAGLNTITWNLGIFNPGDNVNRSFSGNIDSSLSVGTTVLTNTVELQRGVYAITVFQASDYYETIETATDTTSVTVEEHEPIAMSIAKAVDLEIAGHGNLVTYNIEAVNANHTDTCHNATLTITDDLTDVFVDATLVSTDATTQDGNVLTWIFENVACDATVTGEVVVEVSDQAFDGAIMENNAWVRDNNDNSVNSLKVATEIEAPLAVLSLVKSVDKALANPGDTLAYTVTVSNSGQSDATNVTLLDVLPAGFTFADSKGNNTGNTEAIWDLGILEIGADKTVTYEVLIDSHAGVDTYENLATVTADNHEAVTAKATTDVAVPKVLGEQTPSLTITKSVDQEFANPGNSVNYTVTVTNDGDAPALNAVLTDTLPVGFIFADTGETTATWKLGDIVPTESVTKTYEVKIDSAILAGKYINTATVSADDVKPVSAQATLEIRELQVLGAEIDEEAVLPITGGGLAIVLAGLATLGAGMFLRKKIQ